MKGIIKLTVRTKKISYELELKRKISIIQGNSGTGKTNLFNILKQWKLEKTNNIKPTVYVSGFNKIELIDGMDFDMAEFLYLPWR